jgi:hypothetical protein
MTRTAFVLDLKSHHTSGDPAIRFFPGSRRPRTDAAKSAWFYDLERPGCAGRFISEDG